MINQLTVYFSPSKQPANKYAGLQTSEQDQMNLLGAALKARAPYYGIKAVIGSPTMTVNDLTHTHAKGRIPGRVHEALINGADLYAPIHTNAASSTAANGPIVFARDPEGVKLATAVKDELMTIAPGDKRSARVGTDTFRETYYSSLVGIQSIYIEAEFHHVAYLARWITQNHAAIADRILAGIAKHYGLRKASTPTAGATAGAGAAATAPGMIYRVRTNGEQVGAYSALDGAIRQAQDLLQAGKTVEIVPASVAPAKTTAQIAAEVLKGAWGNGAEREARLKAAGYDPATVQAEVNAQLARG